MIFNGVEVKLKDLKRMVELGEAIREDKTLPTPFRVSGHDIACSALRAIDLYKVYKKHNKGAKK